jgi:hypothetical protein
MMLSMREEKGRPLRVMSTVRTLAVVALLHAR